jgi:hypothetical protein
MWQSPAIFLQHSISTLVIAEAGRQASAGAAVHTKTTTSDRMARHFAMELMLHLLLSLGKGELSATLHRV